MDVNLNAHEARVLGTLLEKGYTTPEQYPLSLNAVTNGCNQKNNRAPQTDFSEAEVTVALTGLQYKHLVGSSTPAGSRVQKWRHNAPEALSLGDRELAVLAELLLRGAQAPGELRTRASRMNKIADQEELGRILGTLQERGFVTRLAPAPGSRAERYDSTLSESVEEAPSAEPAPTPSPGPATDLPPRPAGQATAPLEARVETLEEEVGELRSRLEDLARRLGETL